MNNHKTAECWVVWEYELEKRIRREGGGGVEVKRMGDGSGMIGQAERVGVAVARLEDDAKGVVVY